MFPYLLLSRLFIINVGFKFECHSVNLSVTLLSSPKTCVCLPTTFRLHTQQLRLQPQILQAVPANHLFA
jgi:hypothetical protein